MTQPLLDMSRDLEELVTLAGDPERLDELLDYALDALSDAIEYDLAAVLRLEGDQLRVYAARGRLKNEKVMQHSIPVSEHPSLRRVLETRQAKLVDESVHESGEGDIYDNVLDLPHGHSCMVVPLHMGDRSIGLMSFDSPTCGLYNQETVNTASIFGQVISLAIFASDQVATLNRYQKQLEGYTHLLQSEGSGTPESGALLETSTNAAMKRLVSLSRQVAATTAPVLIQGETGTGKEVVARAIHGWSPRHNRPFVAINCAALPETLIESELFGHTKGAFSGAARERAGRFQIANGGTLLLDEVGDLPLPVQAKLLRVLQEGTFEPLGSDKTVKVDVRIIAASHVNLENAVREDRFREDLYYRLNVFPVHLPPLRERLEDIDTIGSSYLTRLAASSARGPWVLTNDALDHLRSYPWPGNVRELINALEHATILKPKGELDAALFEMVPASRLSQNTEKKNARMNPAPTTPSFDQLARDWPSLREMERRYIESTLERTGGKVYGKDGAAALLEMRPTTLQSRMKKLGIR